MSQSTYTSPFDAADESDLAPTGEDETSVEQTDDDADEDGDETGTATKATSARRRRTSGIDKATIRRVLAKAEQIEQADDKTVSLLAATLGSGEDTADLVVAIFEATKRDLSALDDATALLEGDPAMAAISYLTSKPADQRSTWQVLHALDVLPATAPSADAKAAQLLVERIKGLDGDSTANERIAAAVELASKTGR